MQVVFKSLIENDHMTKKIVENDVKILICDYFIDDQIDRVNVHIEKNKMRVKTKICFHGVYNINITASGNDSSQSFYNALYVAEKKLRKKIKVNSISKLNAYRTYYGEPHYDYR